MKEMTDTPGKMAHADAQSRAVLKRIYPLGPGWAELSESQKEKWERMARVKIISALEGYARRDTGARSNAWTL